MNETSATSNISRRYRLLFTLPPIWVNVPLSFLVPALLVVLSGLSLDRIVYVSISVALGVGIEKAILWGDKIANVKRLSIISFTSNLFWLLTFLIGYPFSGWWDLLLSGMFMAIGYRIIVFRAVFFDDPLRPAFTSFVQPFLILVSLFGTSSPFILASNPLINILGIAFASYSALFMELVDCKGKRFFDDKHPIYLFKTFMRLWICGDPDLFESHIESKSIPRTVETYYIMFDKGFVLMIPGVHPGPLALVGSNNLPYDLSVAINDLGFKAVIAHSISGHDMDLPSRGEVERYLSSLRLEKKFRGKRCSDPVYSRRGRITISGMRFNGASLLTLSASPYGIEDFPPHVLEALSREAEERGLFLMLIDSHNSGGPEPNEEDCKNAIKAGVEVLDALKKAETNRFKIAYKNVGDGFEEDVGPLGVSLILIESTRKYAYVFVDANNAVGGIKEYIEEAFKREEVELVELCTTDTHFNSGKIRTRKGYYYLGEATPKERIRGVLLKMLREAKKELTSGGFWYGSVRSDVRVVGSEVWKEFSRGMDATFRLARRLILPLVPIFFATIIVSAI